jgi:NAD(P)H-hydrate epimerase
LVADLEVLRAATGRSVVAVDVASGLWAGRQASEPALTARWTLTPGPFKDFCFFPANRPFCGDLVEVALAFPRPAESSARLLEETDLPPLVPPVGPHAHKGTRGHVALVGAAPGMTGAMVLSARSAAAAGAGLVTVGLDPGLAGLVAPQVPAFQVRDVAGLASLFSRFDALVIGPGWGKGADRADLLNAFWNTDLPLVLDADGLAAWVALGRPTREAPTVLTPHPGEFLRLGAGSEATVSAAGALAAEVNAVVVLKGSATWILGPDGRRSVWDGGEPTLGTGGSGDCLSGVVGAFLAAGLGPFEAAEAAVALHGLAGRTLGRREGWFTADRLPEELARTSAACRTRAGTL